MDWREYKDKVDPSFLGGKSVPKEHVNTQEPKKIDFGPGISGYSGEYYSRYDSSSGGDGSKWRYGLSSTGSTPVMDHRLLKLNARSMYHDSMQGRAIIDRFADLIAGVGLRLEATPDHVLLGITPEAAEAWAQDVNARFDAFMRTKQFTLMGDMTGYQSQRFVTIQQHRDGEYFTRLHYNKRPGYNPLQVSFIDPMQIDGYALTDTAGYNMVDSGIERNASGQEVAYNVLTYNPRTFQQEKKRLLRVGTRSGRLLMLHGYQREYPNQTRGYSRLSHALQHLENLTDFELSHIKKAINESIVAMYIKPSDKNPASGGGFEDLMSAPVGVYKEPTNPQTPTEAANSNVLDYSELNDINGRPGSWINMGLSEGEDLKTLDGKTPADSYGIFVDAFMKSLSASVSMPIEAVFMQFGDSFSASRAALVLAWQVISIWINELASDYLNPIQEMWLSGEIAAGRISAPGWSDPRLRQGWLLNNWVGFPMPNIDPSKTAKAQQMHVEMGATTLDRVARELNGSSGKANRAQLKREFEELPPSPFKPAPVEAGQKEDKEDKDGNSKSK